MYLLTKHKILSLIERAMSLDYHELADVSKHEIKIGEQDRESKETASFIKESVTTQLLMCSCLVSAVQLNRAVKHQCSNCTFGFMFIHSPTNHGSLFYPLLLRLEKQIYLKLTFPPRIEFRPCTFISPLLKFAWTHNTLLLPVSTE